MKSDDAMRVAECDPRDLEMEVAQEEFLIMAQEELQRLLNDRGLRYRDLARLLKVTETRVSKMFRDDAANLTLRSVAKIFFLLGETAVISSQSEIDRKLAEARGTRFVAATGWTAEGFRGSFAQFGSDVELVENRGSALDAPLTANLTEKWIVADRAVSAAVASGARA